MRTRNVVVMVLVSSSVVACAAPAERTTPATTTAAAESVAPIEDRAAPPPPDPTPQGRRVLTRQDLPAAVREFLRDRMARHGDSMETLLWATLNLQHTLIIQHSEWVAAETGIPRPPQADASDPINQVLPARFFELQDDLRRYAGELGRAAQRRDDEGIARAYGQLATTCIRCHGLYLGLPEGN